MRLRPDLPGYVANLSLGCEMNGAVYTMSDMDHLCFDTTKIDKIQDLRRRGVTVYPYKFERTDTTSEIKRRFSDIGHERSAEAVSTAGRATCPPARQDDIADIGDRAADKGLRKNDLGEESFNLFRYTMPETSSVSSATSSDEDGEITICRPIDPRIRLSSS